MVDNQTTLEVLNLSQMGSSHSDQNDSIARKIRLWCIQHHIWLSAAHIAGSRNVEADFQSWSVDFSSEWKLDTRKLRLALSILQFTPNTNLFASSINLQFPCYVAYTPDTDCVAVYAFSLKWQPLQFYAFPPLCVINRVLQKILQDQVSGVLVVPDWPTRAWYSLLARICTPCPILLRPSLSLLFLPSNQLHHHAMCHKLSLLVYLASGIVSEQEVCFFFFARRWGLLVLMEAFHSETISISNSLVGRVLWLTGWKSLFSFLWVWDLASLAVAGRR